jgi:hypothetical protein
MNSIKYDLIYKKISEMHCRHSVTFNHGSQQLL